MTSPRVLGRNALTRSVLDGDREDAPAGAVTLTYTCHLGHDTTVRLWEEAEHPATWKCRVCSTFATLPDVDAGEDTERQWRPAHVPFWEPKTHLEQLHERRTDAELEALLQERLTLLRRRRGEIT